MDIENVDILKGYFCCLFQLVADIVHRDWSIIRSYVDRGGDGMSQETWKIVMSVSKEKHLIMVCENLLQYPRVLYNILAASPLASRGFAPKRFD